VRNPFDWLISQYFYAKGGGNKRIRDKMFYKRWENSTFEEFFTAHYDERISRFGPKNSKYYDERRLSGNHLQCRWLVNKKGEMLVDYVGRYEEIEKVKKRICSVMKNRLKNNNNIVKRKVKLSGCKKSLTH